MDLDLSREEWRIISETLVLREEQLASYRALRSRATHEQQPDRVAAPRGRADVKRDFHTSHVHPLDRTADKRGCEKTRWRSNCYTRTREFT